MSRTWRARAQLLAGLVLVALALWLVLTQGSGEGGAAGSPSAGTSSATAQPSAATTGRVTPSPGGGETPDSGLPRVAASELPPEGRETLGLIHAGGPYPYDRDGTTFQNRERLLPQQPRGYYAEYTVPTPGESDRGARRLVVGDRGDVYWTEDHYASFRQVEEDR